MPPAPARVWRRTTHPRWWVHLLGWALLAAPIAVLVDWWAAPAGIVGFELLLTALVLRRRPVPAGGGGWYDPGSGGAGVREPRRPLPTSGAGAATFGPAASGTM